MISVFGWTDPNTWDVARAEKSYRIRLPAALDSSAFLNSRNIPACLDQAIQTQKPLGNCLFHPK